MWRTRSKQKRAPVGVGSTGRGGHRSVEGASMQVEGTARHGTALYCTVLHWVRLPELVAADWRALRAVGRTLLDTQARLRSQVAWVLGGSTCLLPEEIPQLIQGLTAAYWRMVPLRGPVARDARDAGAA